MIRPENINDETLEYAARLIEETDFSDLGGILSRPKGTRRKRLNEDIELRQRTAALTRARCATVIRRMKGRRDLDARQVLADLAADLPKATRHDVHLTDAWPLAWKGWLNITCTIRCTDNGIPPETVYRIALTEKGRQVLAGDAA